MSELPRTWEYKISILDWLREKDDSIGALEGDLNELGAQGWELVSVTPKMGKNDSWTFAYLKRPRLN